MENAMPEAPNRSKVAPTRDEFWGYLQNKVFEGVVKKFEGNFGTYIIFI